MKNIRLLFDLRATQPVGSSQYHGGGEYAKAVFRKLLQLMDKQEIAAFYDPSKWLDPTVSKLCQKHNVKLFPVRNRKELEALISNGRFDRVYTALPYEYYGIDFSNVELYYTIHGLRSIEMPTDKYELKYGHRPTTVLKHFFKILFSNYYITIKRKQFADLLQLPSKRTTIFVPSLHTKYTLLSQFPELDPSNIRVLYSPRKQHNEVPPEYKDEVLIKVSMQPREFFLILSADRWIKNAYRAVRALDEIYTQWPQIEKPTLILGSPKGRKPLWKLKNRDRFVCTGYVSSQELEVLYSSAYLLIYPTLNEGFGYPPLECMKYGTPVIASAVASITEVCGDAVLYINPFSIEEIKARILTVLFEPALWEEYSKKGQQRAMYIASKQDEMLDKLCYTILGQ